MQNKHAHVTQQEVAMTPDTVLITKTDAKGIITYCNDEFVKISGYSREELIGRNHNVVRHPDMPASAFKWMWDTLKSERPWRGVVKNRTKSGNHYWVNATVSPIFENNQITGYVSVRRVPARAQITAAEAVYRELNQTGKAVVSGWERYQPKNWSLKMRLQLAIQIPLLLVLVTAQLYITNALEQNLLTTAQEKGNSISSQVFDNSNVLMVTGQIGNTENREMLIKKASGIKDVKSVAILRGTRVVEQYGAGLPHEQASDAAQRKVLEDGKSFIEFKHDAGGAHLMHVITPYLASKDSKGANCTSCHLVTEGTVLGASDITLSLDDEYAQLGRVKLYGWLGQLGLQLFLLVFISFMIDHFVRRPLHQVHQEFRNMMEGNLDTELDVSGQDEMGVLLCEMQSMQCYLRTMMDEIATPVAKMRASILAMGQQVGAVESNSLVEQDHVQTIAATMEELSQSIAEVANMAADSLAGARTTLGIVSSNNQHMELTVTSAGRVAQTVQESSRTIENLGESIAHIGVIANAIKEIADQTNLLALNAAIEAARAGEQGRGFAVVADEVRKLAERTANSTTDITKTINTITATSDAAVQSMHSAVREVDASIISIRENGEGLRQIVSATETMTQRIESIASAAKEQSVAGVNVASSLERITNLVVHNTEMVKEAKQAADNLDVEAESLIRAGYPLTKCTIKR